MGLDIFDKLMGSSKTQGAREGLERADEYGRDLSWRRNAANNAQYRKMVENILMGQESQLGVMQDVYPQYADILQGGYRSATGTTGAGLQASLAELGGGGGKTDLSFLDYQPQQQPDLSFLKDFQMPDFNVSRPKIGPSPQGPTNQEERNRNTSPNNMSQFYDESIQRLMEG